MEGIRGKHAVSIDRAGLTAWAARYTQILIDIGTGDGRYVRHIAQTCPAWGAIGIDTCRDNLRAASRSAPPNALYLIADALALQPELYGLASRIAINFPWGSLLAGLVDGHSTLLSSLQAISRPGVILEVRLNGGALVQQGWSLESGAARVSRALQESGFTVERFLHLDAEALRACPTSWAKRLAFGRDPRAISLRATEATVPVGNGAEVLVGSEIGAALEGWPSG